MGQSLSCVRQNSCKVKPVFNILRAESHMEPAATTHPLWRTILERLGLIVLGIVIVLLLVEFGLRGYFRFFGSLSEKIMYVYSVDEIIAANPSFTGLPFVGFGPSDEGFGHNRLGYRNKEIAIEKPEGVFRIATTGGSTTYGAGVQNEETWPAQLERILHEDYDYTHVEVINTASTAYTTWNSLANFAFRVVDLQPDLLIVYHATNDAKARLTNPECYTGQSPIRGLYKGQWRTTGPDFGPSTIYRFLGVGRGWVPNANELNSWIMPVEESVNGCERLSGVTDAELLQTNPPVYFERNLRNLAHLAHANQTEIFFSTWAYYAPLVEPDYWETAFDENNAITRHLAEEFDAPFYDLQANLPQDRDLWLSDGEHQSAAGTLEQARQYAAYLVETGVISP